MRKITIITWARRLVLLSPPFEEKLYELVLRPTTMMKQQKVSKSTGA